MKLLISHKISQINTDLLQKAGYEITAITVVQNQLINYINDNDFEALITGSKTAIDKYFIDNCSKIKIIGCDFSSLNHDVIKYANSHNIKLVNISEGYAVAVAELVFAHLLGMVRFLHQTNREMPLEGDNRFNEFKTHFSKGSELRGKTIGIIGLGKTGKEVAKIAIGLGMKIITSCSKLKNEIIEISFFDGRKMNFDIKTQPLEDLLKKSDFISIHTPFNNSPLINTEEIKLMKTGVGIINTSFGGVLDEVALIEAINSKKVKYAALDVFENEPKPEIPILMNPEVSLSPHIGGATIESKIKSEEILINNFIEYYKIKE
jgi:D-3-phosphoglycerate dehydrogenase